MNDFIQNLQVYVHSYNISHDIGHDPLNICDANSATSFAQGDYVFGNIMNDGMNCF